MSSSGIVLDVRDLADCVLAGKDDSRYHHVLVNTNAVTVRGLHGRAMYFGGNAYISAAYSPAFDVIHNLTIEAVIRPQVLTSYKTIVTKDYAASPYDSVPFLFTVHEGKLGLAAYDNGVNLFNVDSTTTLIANKFYHVTVTFDDTLGSTNIRFYLNGRADGTGDYTSPLPVNNANLCIGAYTTGLLYKFIGDIESVLVLNLTLELAEVKEHYRQLLPFINTYKPI
jgi:hypothetical protein